MSDGATVRKMRLISPQVDDGILLSRVAAGDLGALGTLYDRHQGALQRFAERATGRDATAEDIVHETFLTAMKSAASFDGRSSCRSWLIGIAARLIMHHGRSIVRLRQMLSRLAWQPVAQARTPDDELARHQSMDRLERALQSLPVAKRVAIVMVEIEEMSCEEAARQLGIPVGTVWTRLHHARRELRNALEGKEEA